MSGMTVGKPLIPSPVDYMGLRSMISFIYLFLSFLRSRFPLYLIIFHSRLEELERREGTGNTDG